MEGKCAIVKRKKNEVRDFYLLGTYPLVGRHVVKTWQEFEVENLRFRKKNEFKKMFGSWMSP